ncbi:MAG TPA: hypothetical protein VKY19_28070 [Ktedonosporobacter sp.]|nr:hypothetical protein [Ktedonosporobacter sp.]
MLGLGVLCVPLSHAGTPRIKKGTPTNEEEYDTVPVIPVDGLLHNENGFCGDIAHEFHEHAASIEKLNQAILDGLATPDDASRIFRGQTV